ncbi:Uncharacterised protein [Helicobacter canis]|uniref:Uncharacterized protein n=1 Tax=Helicobacter canis TaxID=29419 RepID=A0A377J6I3_9HELI|nr:Uncharacterised protein [Helicobacter canis]
MLGGDSACGLESRISSPRFVDRPSSLISLRGLKSHDSSSTILESQSGFTKQVENLESTFESNTAKQAKRCKAKPQQVSLVIPRILGEDNQGDFEKSVVSSLRASFARVAIHKNNAKILESTFENYKHKTQSIASLEKVDSKIEAFLLSLRADLSAWQSTQTKTHNLESTFEKSQKVDRHAIAAALACNDKVGGVDRHADFQSARNDGAIAASQKVDSRENAKILNESQNTKAQSVFDSEAAGCLMKKRGCAAFCAEISLVGFSTNKRQTPRFFAKQAKRCKPKPKQVSLVKSQCLHYKKAL